MADNKIDVCEIYPTLKSTGINAGKRILCIRLFGTNFKNNNDKFRYAWDKNPESMAKHRKIMSIKELINNIGKLETYDYWLITGGEPLLQKSLIVELIEEYKQIFGVTPFIEVETNGFITPDKKLDKYVNSYCVDVKLSNTMNGNAKSTFGSRIQEKTLKWFKKNKKAYFLFSVGTQSDIQEVVEIQKLFKINSDFIYLKPSMVDSRGIARGINVLWNACLSKGYTLSNKFFTNNK